MSCFKPEVREIFEKWDHHDLLQSLEASHRTLLDRRVEAIEYGAPQKLTGRQRAFLNCQMLQQILLHRAERLLVSSGTMLLETNIYGLALLIRGHFEATAVLGYVCSRMESLAIGTIEFEVFEWNIADCLLAAKHDTFTEARPPINILTCIDAADKYADKHLFDKKQGMVRDIYNWLSEFAHPNFLSNFSAFTLDKPNNRFLLRHQGELRKDDFQLPNYLEISSGLFAMLYDQYSERLNSISAAESYRT